MGHSPAGRLPQRRDGAGHMMVKMMMEPVEEQQILVHLVAMVLFPLFVFLLMKPLI